MTNQNQNAYDELLELSGGDLEKLARWAVVELEATKVKLVVLQEENRLLYEVFAQGVSKTTSATRGRPKKIRLGITRANKIKKLHGRPANNKLPVKNAAILHHAKYRQHQYGGTLISQIKGIIQTIMVQTDIAIAESDLQSLASAIAKKSERTVNQTTQLLLTSECGNNWLTQGLGYAPPNRGK
jgi:hypothetical protein